MDYTKLIDIGSKVSLAVVLMVILYGGVTGYWVAGSTYQDVVKERDTWKELALKGTKVAEQAAHTLITGPQDAQPPLPSNASPAEVNARLEVLRNKTAYKTEPTDLPLP